GGLPMTVSQSGHSPPSPNWLPGQ
ncbi:MAG: hypothetical protein V7605_1200, partial [Acidimicrobiaceae bacterium]